ncbi:MAG: Co2+/Mg2+ efflux protein ApaG [Pseudomonadota bacterium]|nr:Co2+/Mg2+ efflux protein ApaG [Pseudomonadota bacterium]
MYEATTGSIRVCVEPAFQEEDSSPGDSVYFWSYTVEIENLGEEPVQLRSRYWRITDSAGKTEEVRGAGVVGQEPVIEPGGSFRYTSGAPLGTESGIMVGSYQMQSASGGTFQVAIPAFSLDSPYTRATVN